MKEFVAKGLKKQISRFQEKGHTGCISITEQKNGKSINGLLQFNQGKLTAAKYGSLKGQDAVEAIKSVSAPTIAFAKGKLLEEDGKPITLGVKKLANKPSNSRKPQKKGNPEKINIKVGFGIFPRMFLIILFVALIPLAGLLYNNVRAQQDWKESLNLSLSKTATAVSTSVNDWVDMNLRSMRNAAALEDIVSMDPSRQYSVLKAQDDTYEWSYTAFTTDLEGNAITRSDGKPLKYYGDREYVQQILNGEPFGQQVLISRVNNKPALCLSTGIKDVEVLVGVLVTCSSLLNISEEVTNVKIGETGAAFLVDSKGRLIAHGNTEVVTEELQDFSNHSVLLSGLDSESLTFEDESGNRILAHTQELSLNWKLVVQQNYTEAFAPLINAQNNAYLLLGITILLVFLVAYLFAKRLVKPITRLTSAADRISRGELVVSVEGTKRSDEVGALARAIDRMAMSLKIIFDDLRSASLV